MNVKLSNRAYSVLKGVAQIWLPAMGTLYVTLAAIWNLPAVEQVTGTVIGVDTFLGVILGLSSSSYKASDDRFDATLALQNHPEGGAQVRMLGLDPEALVTKKELTFKVVDQTTTDPDAVEIQAPQSSTTDPRLLR